MTVYVGMRDSIYTCGIYLTYSFLAMPIIPQDVNGDLQLRIESQYSIVPVVTYLTTN